MSDDNDIVELKFESSIAFKFWKTLARLDIRYAGWKLAAYWRERGYDV